MSSSDGLEPTERTDRKGYKRVMLKLGGEMFCSAAAKWVLTRTW